MFLKYRDQGLYALPCKKASKATALQSGYSLIEWSSTGIPETLLAEWDEKFPIKDGWGIALLCGEASGVIGLDIDSSDPELLSLMPFSPCVKVGKTGQTRFYKYSNEFSQTQKIKPQIKLSGKEEVEICSNGKYTLLPPSIHEDTKLPYLWISEDDLYRIDLDELPELDADIVERVQSYYAKKFGYAHDVKKPVIDLSEVHQSVDGRCAHGSHDRLKKKAVLLIEQELPINDAVLELYKYDKTHHEGVSYFEDRSRGADSKCDPKTNALRFYANMLSYINVKRLRSNEKPLECVYDFEKSFSPVFAKKIAYVPYPKAFGVMGDFQKYCGLVSNGDDVEALSLGAALSLMSVLCANRVRTQLDQYDIRPNIYVLNIAPSGAGKETPQRLVSELLSESGLLGAASYKSGTSIIQTLPKQQERLNVIDEAAAFLKSIASGEGFQQEINDVLSGLYTKASTKFDGFAFADKGETVGACWNPSVSILASTTVFGFAKAANRSMAEKGLLPRFQCFKQDDGGNWKRATPESLKEADKLKSRLREFVKIILSEEKIIADGFKEQVISEGIKYTPRLIKAEHDAVDLFFEYKKKFFAAKGRVNESFEAPFQNRFAENAAKNALLYSISIGAPTISLEAMQWGIDVIDAQWANARALYEETSAENQLEAESVATLNKIKNAGEISKRDLKRSMKGIGPKRKDEIINELIDLKIIDHRFAKDHKSGPEKQMLFAL